MQIRLWHLAALAALAAASACSESGTAPQAASPSARPTPVAPATAFDYSNGGRFGAQSNSFTLTAQGGSFNVNGLFTLNFPANSVCDPGQSSYGPGHWDDPCVTLSGDQSIQLHSVVVLTPNGMAVDFSPHLRFSPNTIVTISTNIFAPVLLANPSFFAQHPNSLSALVVSYSPSLSDSPVDDYVSDPSLITHVNLSTGQIWRRVKHFSGYSVTNGQPCDPSPDNPDCVEVDGLDQP